MSSQTCPSEREEQRRQTRLAMRLPAKIFPKRLSCQLLDISPRGARLQFEDVVDLPEQFVLVEWNSGRAYQCRVPWRRGVEAGVEFLESVSLLRETPEIFAAAKRAWTGASDRAPTTFSVHRHDRQWAVTVSGPSLDEPAIVAVFTARWEARAFARSRAKSFEGKATATVP